MKQLILALLFCSPSLSVVAQQVNNFDKAGKNAKSLSEFVKIELEVKPGGRGPAAVGALAGIVLGPVINIASSLVKNGLEKRQKSFTASYSNTVGFEKDKISMTGGKTLIVSRYAINDLSQLTSENLTTEFRLLLIPGEERITIKLKDLLLRKSKARYRNEKDNLTVSINLKVTSMQKTETKKGSAEKKEDDSEPKTTEVTKEATINVPIIKVSDDTKDLSTSDVINEITLHGIDLKSSEGLTFGVTVTETNINRVDPSLVQSLVSNNSTDIQNILKAIFGVEDKK